MESITRPLKISNLKVLVLLLACSVLTGCATTEPLYFWGNYEDLIYGMYLEPVSADTTTQVAKLKEDINKASTDGKPVPPGLHAHLGYIYFIQGDTNAAALEFETEKNCFQNQLNLLMG